MSHSSFVQNRMSFTNSDAMGHNYPTVYMSEEGPWDNYTTGRNNENVQGVYLGEGSWSSDGFSGEDMAGPSTTVREVRRNI